MLYGNVIEEEQAAEAEEARDNATSTILEEIGFNWYVCASSKRYHGVLGL